MLSAGRTFGKELSLLKASGSVSGRYFSEIEFSFFFSICLFLSHFLLSSLQCYASPLCLMISFPKASLITKFF